MKKLAIVVIAAAIFTVALQHAHAQQFIKIEHESTVQKQLAEKNTRQATSDTPQAAKTVEVASTPIQETKAPETAPKTAEIGCGPHDPALVYQILRETGVPRESAIQLLGSWKTESGGDFNQCQQIGDNGQAWGLNSWHPGRRYDMPFELRAQINWAVHTEMKRDCSSCYERIMAGGDVYSIRVAIQQTTRWGVPGARWSYADQFASMF